MLLTSKDVADKLGISYVVASGLMTYLEQTGKISVAEKRLATSGRGKPTKIYKVDQFVTIDFGFSLEMKEAA